MKLFEIRTPGIAVSPSPGFPASPLPVHPSPAEAAASVVLSMATDSSVVTNGRPVFLPDLSSRWQCEISAAYRIGRLGKTVAGKFAHRYIDAVTLVARMVPVDLAERLGSLSSPLASAFDGAVAAGRWLPLPMQDDDDGVALDRTLDITVASPVAGECRFNGGAVRDALAYLSRYFIIKTGDVVIPCAPQIEFGVNIDTHVSASLNNQEVLTFNIK